LTKILSMVPPRKALRLRLLTVLCLLYLALTVYASLMPFDLHADLQLAGANFRRAWGYWPFGNLHRVSRGDMLSNLLLYCPLGALLAARWSLGRSLPRAVVVLCAAGGCLATSVAVELMQTFSSSRTSSALDVLMNAGGGLAGALAGLAFGRRAWLRVLRAANDRWVRRPMILPACLLACLLAIDAWLPFRPTLDVSTVKASLRASYRSLHSGLAAHPWHHWLVQRVYVYAAVSVLFGASSLLTSRRRWLRGAGGALLLACALEASKPFIIGRFANFANVLTAAAGCGLGLAAGALCHGRVPRRAQAWVGALAALAYLGYLVLLAVG